MTIQIYRTIEKNKYDRKQKTSKMSKNPETVKKYYQN